MLLHIKKARQPTTSKSVILDLNKPAFTELKKQDEATSKWPPVKRAERSDPRRDGWIGSDCHSTPIMPKSKKAKERMQMKEASKTAVPLKKLDNVAAAWTMAKDDDELQKAVDSIFGPNSEQFEEQPSSTMVSDSLVTSDSSSQISLMPITTTAVMNAVTTDPISGLISASQTVVTSSLPVVVSTPLPSELTMWMGMMTEAVCTIKEAICFVVESMKMQQNLVRAQPQDQGSSSHEEPRVVKPSPPIRDQRETSDSEWREDDRRPHDWDSSLQKRYYEPRDHRRYDNYRRRGHGRRNRSRSRSPSYYY